MRSILTRLTLALSLLAGSWHPVAAQVIGQAVGAASSSGIKPIVVRVSGPLTRDGGGSIPGSGLSVPHASLGSGLFSPGVSIQGALPGASLAPSVESAPSPAAGLPQPVVLAATPADGIGRSAAVPGVSGDSLLGRAHVLVGSLQASPRESPRPDADAEAVPRSELSRVYDGLTSGLKALPADPVETGPAGVQSDSPSPDIRLNAPSGLESAPRARTNILFRHLSRLLPRSEKERSGAKKSIVATGVFKIGMEALGVSMPLIALTLFGSAVWMANLAVTWGISMTVASMLAGGWMDRKPVHKVMSRAMVVQAAAVAGIMGLFLAGLGTAWLVVPLYAVAGASMGVVVTGRNLLPAKILGNDHANLGKFNAVTHLVYEVAGTIAPILVGLLISKVGLVAGLFLHPPAYLLAAWLFSRLQVEDPSAPAQPSRTGKAGTEGRSGWRAWLTDGFSVLYKLAKNAVADVRAGHAVMWRDRGFRWVGIMLLGPMIVHRVFESMLVPFFVKNLLGSPERVAWVVSGSNFGELLGALLLIKAMTSMGDKKPSSPYRWIRPMALGTLATWSLVLTGNLWLIIPLVLVMSLSWAANDINLTSYLQSRLPEDSAGKAMGFLMAAELAAIMGISYVLGFMFDGLAPMTSLIVVNVAATLLAALFWRGKKHLKDSTAGVRH